MGIPVTVKWGKNSYDVEADTSQPPAVFKSQLYSLTGVPPERQKVMVKGGFLKDDSEWDKVALKQGQKLMLMGTADKVPEAPKEQMVFMEDLPEDEQDHSGLSKYGAGLQNLGNTCYMNSTVQCLYRIPELRTSLQQLDAQPAAPGGTAARKLALAARDLFANLERRSEPVMPLQFLLQLRQLYPQFAQQGNTGAYMQQDAEECWTNLLFSLKEALQAPAGGESSDPAVQQLLGVRLHTQLACGESGEVSAEDSTAFSLKCNIDSTVNHLSEGLRLGLRDDREKTSAALGRLAKFEGSSTVTRLPPYLTVQLVRFFYKRDVQQKSKILRKVNFPLVLDCFEFCSEEYRKQLEGPRAAWQAAEDRKAGLAKAAKAQAAAAKEEARAAGGRKRPPPEQLQAAAPPPAPEAAKPDAGGDAEMADADAGAAAGEASGAGAFVGQHTGKYELAAVLTHKGRSADSGHYVSWAKQDDGSWVQFDDEEMIPRREEEIIELNGGGDWHMAYLLLYRALKVAA